MTKNQKIKEAARFGRLIDFWSFILRIATKVSRTAEVKVLKYTVEQDVMLNDAMFGDEPSKTAKHEFKSQEAES